MDKILLGATTPGQSGPGSDGYEWVFRISQISKAWSLASDGW